MNTKTVGMIFAVFLLTIAMLACADGGSSGSGSSKSSGSIERMSNLEIAREVMRCGIDNGQEVAKDLVILYGSQAEAARFMAEVSSRNELIQGYREECE